MSFLEISNVSKRYGLMPVLRNVSFGIDEGGFLVLVGPSGCGKSTLLSIVAGLDECDEGGISIGGRAMAGLPPAQRDIAMVFQSYALYPNMSVAENMSFGLEMRGIPKGEREEAVGRAAEILQITHLLERRPSQLSGGQRQRVAMGRALVRKPKVFLFDEPLSNLDAKLRVEMRTEIKRLHQRTGVTMVYVTHDQVEAMTLSTKIAVLKDGLLQQTGTPAEIYGRPTNLFVAQFMGSPPMNIIEGTFAAPGGIPSVEVPGCDKLIPVTSPTTLEGVNAGAKVLVGIRPEALVLQTDARSMADSMCRFSATVEVVEPTGPDVFALFSLGSREVTARLQADASLVAGDHLPLAFAMDKAAIFDANSGKALNIPSLA